MTEPGVKDKAAEGVDQRSQRHGEGLSLPHPAAEQAESRPGAVELSHHHQGIGMLQIAGRGEQGKEEKGVEVQPYQNIIALSDAEIPLGQCEASGMHKTLQSLIEIVSGIAHDDKVDVLTVGNPDKGTLKIVKDCQNHQNQPGIGKGVVPKPGQSAAFQLFPEMKHA